MRTVTALFYLGIAALVARKRCAWLLLILFEGAVLISFAIDFTHVWAFLIVAASFSLLGSPEMRRFVTDRPRPGVPIAG